jgi:DNA-binding response OmpR family regulator
LRPKKVILCIGADEQLLSQRAFLLETHGYRVVKAESAKRGEDILRQVPESSLDLVIVHAPIENALPLLRAAFVLHPFTRTMVTSDFVGYDSNLAHAQTYMPKGTWSAAELLERVHIMVARKRGPTKKTHGATESAAERKECVA